MSGIRYRKFRHKKTEDVVTYNYCFVEYYGGQTKDRVKIYLPKALVEDSNDWEEIKEEL